MNILYAIAGIGVVVYFALRKTEKEISQKVAPQGGFTWTPGGGLQKTSDVESNEYCMVPFETSRDDVKVFFPAATNLTPMLTHLFGSFSQDSARDFRDGTDYAFWQTVFEEFERANPGVNFTYKFMLKVPMSNAVYPVYETTLDVLKRDPWSIAPDTKYLVSMVADTQTKAPWEWVQKFASRKSDCSTPYSFDMLKTNLPDCKCK